MDIDMNIEIDAGAMSSQSGSHAIYRRRDIEWLALGLSLFGLFTALGWLERVLVELAWMRVDALALPLARAGVELAMLAPLVVLAPLAVLGSRLLRRGSLDLGIAASVGLALVLFALACFCVGVGLEFSLAQGFVGLGSIAAASMFACMAVCVLPSSLGLSQRLEWRIAGLCLAAIGCGLGRMFVGPPPGLDALFDACLARGLGAVALAVVLVLAWRSFAELAWAPAPARARGLELRGPHSISMP